MLQTGVLKKAKGEYWGVLHFGNPLYHVWAQRAVTYRQAMRAAKCELQKRAAQPPLQPTADHASSGSKTDTVAPVVGGG